MTSSIHSFPEIKERLFERLRQARLRLGLKQSELAEIGQVSRATQASYETDTTAPNTEYLRLVQAAGIDIPFVLFGMDSSSPSMADASLNVNWRLVQEAFEAVEFFCIKSAPNCPSSYKWQLIQRVYAELVAMQADKDNANPTSHLELVRHAWEKV